ncbi:MAG: hypothetical protein RIR49_2086 [Actinomycetota bacterium]|jgi:hypothetical protein
MSADTQPTSDAMTSSHDAIEVKISLDLVKRAVYITPIAVAVAAMIWDGPGAASALFAIGLVIVNFLLSAVLVSGAARISVGLVMGATLFGYLIRLGLILVAFLLVRDLGWISRPALGSTIIVSHLGLLVWELKFVAISLAHAGIKPARP